MTQALGVDGVNSSLKSALVSFDDHQVLAVEVERLAVGRVVVFLPGAPDPWSGSVVIVTQERLTTVPVEIGALHRSVKRIGRGSAGLSNATLVAAPGGLSEPAALRWSCCAQGGLPPILQLLAALLLAVAHERATRSRPSRYTSPIPGEGGLLPGGPRHTDFLVRLTWE